MGVYETLCAILGRENVQCEELMSKHTTFRVGGPADYFVTPESETQIQETIKYLKREHIPYYILGKGSNLLVGDKGYRGVILQIYRKMDKAHTEGTKIYAQAGISLAKLAAAALHDGLTGLEFASGIPGTLGGAVMMNAGAYGGEMKQVLVSVRSMTSEGIIREYSAEELELEYRTSIFAKNGEIILSAVLQLAQGDSAQIQAYMDELKTRRLEKTAVGISECRKHIQAAGRIFCRKAD